MKNIILVLTGGAMGSVIRYFISELAAKYLIGLFPYGTLIVNLTGSFIIGVLFGFLDVGNITSGFRLFIIVGFLGGFTTFSTYTWDTFILFKDGQVKIALLNILSNNLAGILLVFLGFYLGCELLKISR